MSGILHPAPGGDAAALAEAHRRKCRRALIGDSALVFAGVPQLNRRKPLLFQACAVSMAPPHTMRGFTERALSRVISSSSIAP